MAQVVVEMSSDEAKLFRAQQKIIDQQKKLDQGYKKVGKSAKNSGRQAETTMSKVKTVAAGVGGAIVALASQLTGMLKQADAQVDELASKFRSAAGALGEIGQLDPERVPIVRKQAREIFRRGGGASLDEASQLAFALESAGILTDDNVALFSKLRSSQLTKQPTQIAGAASKVQAAFGADETGSIRDILSKGFEASRITQSTLDQVLSAVAAGGSFAKAQGLSDEATFAAVATIERSGVNISEAGTQFKRLAQKLSLNERFRGRDLASIAEELAPLDPAARLKAVGGSTEALAGINAIINNLDAFRAATEGSSAAQSRDQTGLQIAGQRNDLTVGAAERKQVAENAAVLAGEESGRRRTLVQSVTDEITANIRSGAADRRGGILGLASSLTPNELEAFSVGFFANTVGTFGGDEFLLRNSIQNQSADLFSQVARELSSSSESLSRAAGNLEQSSKTGNARQEQAQAAQVE